MITKHQIYDFINYQIILWTLLLGVIFYDYIAENTGFSYMDELLVLFLFGYFIKRGKQKKELFVCMTIFIFYLFYSLIIQTNVSSAIWTDFFIEIKPFVAFYTVYSIRLSISDRYKARIRKLCVVIALMLIPLGLSGPDHMSWFLMHSRYATAMTILGFLYFYCSQKRKKDIYVMFAIWTIGLLSLRSKMFSFYGLSCCVFLFWKDQKINFSIKTLLMVLAGISLSIYIVWEKFSFYFIEGTSADSMFARPYLYLNAWYIINDYIPFGSGFGSYATFASSMYYSPIYFDYKMYRNHEIGNNLFVADTFYPALAQFGYVGVLLFIYFWYKIFQKNQRQFNLYNDVNNYKISILIIVFFVIESVADSTFTHNRGMMMLMLLAMFLTDNKRKLLTVY